MIPKNIELIKEVRMTGSQWGNAFVINLIKETEVMKELYAMGMEESETNALEWVKEEILQGDDTSETEYGRGWHEAMQAIKRRIEMLEDEK